MPMIPTTTIMANPISPTAVPDADDDITLDPQTIDFLKNCTSSQLSQQLSHHRGCSPSETSVFLKQAYQDAEQAALALISQASTDLEGMLLEEPLETSLLSPRMGKVSIQLSHKGFLATRLNLANSSQQAQLLLKKGSVSHLIVFPKPEDCKLIKQGKFQKVKGHVILFKLRSKMTFQGKEMDQVCFALPWNKTDGCTMPKLNAAHSQQQQQQEIPKWKRAADAWRLVLTEALSCQKVSHVQVNSTVFTSHMDMGTSTTTSGMPFVSCNRGVQDGVLYPLKQGLLFFKPPKFLPVTDMCRIEFSRGRSAGQSSNRYVDFGVVMQGETNYEEFSNILCQEEGPLQEYNDEYILPFLSNDNDEDQEEVEVVEAEAVDTEEEDSDEDDDDFEEGDEEDEDGEETDDDEGGIQIVADEMMKELKETAAQKRNESSSDSDTDQTQSETEAMDEDGNPIKRRKSKRLKRQ